MLTSSPERALTAPRRRRLVSLRVVGKLIKNALALVLAAGCIGYGLLFAFHLAPLVMLTGSMGTTIPTGSLVVDQTVPPSELRVGDVISFQKPIGSHGIDTHRIIEIQRSNGHVAYRTKGDGNARPDEWSISFPPHTKANRVFFSVPYLGWVLLYLRMPLVRTLILATVLLTIFSTFLKALAIYGSAAKERKADEDDAPTLELVSAEVVPPELVSVEPSTALVVRRPGAVAVQQRDTVARWRPALVSALALAAFAIAMAVRAKTS